MEPSPLDATSVLNKLAGGESQAAAELFPLVYEELRRIAGWHLRQERPNHTLQATALVHEAYVKLVRQDEANWQNRAHFFAVASQVMRHVLVDYARGRLREKRGANPSKVPLEVVAAVSEVRFEELLAVNESLARLEKIDARQSRIVQLRYFGGLSVEEVAEVLGVSEKTVKRDWSIARAWLYGDLRARDGNDARQLGENQGAV